MAGPILKNIFDTSGGTWYDAVYAAKDYRAETGIILELIRTNLKREPASLLDIGCGTGLHLQYVPGNVSVTGIDIAESQLQLARQRLPRHTFLQGDMRDFDLPARFDAVICMFSSIAYLHTYQSFAKAIRNMARHMGEDGVLLIEPWVTAAAWNASLPSTTHSFKLPGKSNTTITRKIYKSTEEDLSVLDMHFVQQLDSGETREFHEVHKMLLCRPEDYARAFHAANLHLAFYEHGLFPRGIYVGTRLGAGR